MRPLLVFAFAACSSSAPPPTTTAKASTSEKPFEIDYVEAERMAWKRAQPVFQRHCARCHMRGMRGATTASLELFDMTKYPFEGTRKPIIGDALRDVLGQSGMDATMPKDRKGSVRGDDLATLLAWSDAWAKTH